MDHTSREMPITLSYTELEGMLKPLLEGGLQGLQDQHNMDTPTAATDVDSLLLRLQHYLAMHVHSSQSMEAKGMPLPEVDEQLLPLQQQVEEVMQRVAQHRANVPAVIAKALEQQLQQMRPADADDLEPADQGSCPAGALSAEGPQEVLQPRELQEALRTALNKLPALRARLEEMDVRLQRNLTAVDEAHQANASQPPRTVERVLRSIAASQGDGAAGAGVDGAAEAEA